MSKKSLTVLVTGSRYYTSELTVMRTLSQVAKAHPGWDITLLSGGSRGADAFAEDTAESLGFTVRRFPARWEEEGKKAGVLRNLRMIRERPDLCIAYPHPRKDSRGTAHCVREAVKAGIPTHIVALKKDGSYRISLAKDSDWFNEISRKRS